MKNQNQPTPEMTSSDDPSTKVFSTDEMLAEERNHINLLRKELGKSEDPTSYTALCLSGGGIRSAAFSMGVLQAFAEARLVAQLDYISAVSGGGYALGWWSALVKRIRNETPPTSSAPKLAIDKLRTAEAHVSDNGIRFGGNTASPHDPFERSYVRAHGNYLTIRTGIISADTWTTVCTIARNLIYGLSGLGLSFVLLCYTLIALTDLADSQSKIIDGWLPLIGGLLFASGWALTNATLQIDADQKSNARKSNLFLLFLTGGFLCVSFHFVNLAAFPHSDLASDIGEDLLFFALIVDLAYLAINTAKRVKTGANWPPECFAMTTLTIATAMFFGGQWNVILLQLTTALQTLLNYRWTANADIDNWQIWIVLIACHAWEWSSIYYAEYQPSRATNDPGASSRAETYGRPPAGPPLKHELQEDRNRRLFTLLVGFVIIGLFSIFAIIMVIPVLPTGLINAGSGRLGIQAAQLIILCALGGLLWNALLTVAQGAQRNWILREIWARWGAELLIAAGGVGLLVLCDSLALYAVRAHRQLNPAWPACGALTCLLLSSIDSPRNVLRPVFRGVGFAAMVFTGGVAFEFAIDWYILCVGDTPQANLWTLHFKQMWPLAFSLLSGWVILRSGPNTFSMHELYKNRLVRAFLGASNPNGDIIGFIDFSPKDDLLLSQLSVSNPANPTELVPLRPFPVWSATINVTDSSQIGLQERKAASFSFTPLRCGYQIATADRTKQTTQRARHAAAAAVRAIPAYAASAAHGREFQKTNLEIEEEPLYVGRVMATSGAAFSSNTGATTKPEKALLLSLLGFRLGVWFPNPASTTKSDGHTAIRPWFAGVPVYLLRGTSLVERFWPNALPLIVREAFSRCDISSDAVYVTDGGHFDNLGVYEMIRRRVKVIVATDAVCDPKYEFSDLLNMQTKVRTDFGVEIEIAGLDQLRPSTGKLYAEKQITAWRIIYSRNLLGEPSEIGMLIYCKSTLTGVEAEDLLDYKRRTPSFPHLTTVNQWFAESTFEAYRALGLHIGRVARDKFREINAP